MPGLRAGVQVTGDVRLDVISIPAALTHVAESMA